MRNKTKIQKNKSQYFLEPLALSGEQSAELFGISRAMWFKQLDAGRIGPIGVRLGRCVRFSVEELKAWAAAGMPPRHEWQRIKNKKLNPPD